QRLGHRDVVHVQLVGDVLADAIGARAPIARAAQHQRAITALVRDRLAQAVLAPRMAVARALERQDLREVLGLRLIEQQLLAQRTVLTVAPASRTYSGRSASGPCPSPRARRGAASRASVPARNRLRSGKTARASCARIASR